MKNLAYITCLFLLFACEGRREFPPLLEKGVNLSKYDIILLQSGKTQDITATFEPDIVPNRDYVWTIDNPAIAKLEMKADKSVALTATGSGETTVTITAKDDPSITASAPLKVISGPPVDITDQATITVNKENGGGPTANEGSPKLVDGKTNTKFLSNYSAPFYVNLEFKTPVVAGYYALVSGNDAPDRDPRDWEIQGSNDGVTFVTLDTRTAYTFSGRVLTREFYFKNSKAYKIYRFDIKKNNGGGLFQMQEWRLFNLPG